MRTLAVRALLGFSLCAPVSGAAQAEPGPTVTREAEAQHCPDGAELAARVARIRGASGEPDMGAYEVTFSRRGQEFAAAIRAGASEANVRMITARGATCEALAQATAVTLALLLDAEAAPPPPAPPTEPEPAKAEAPRPNVAATPAPERLPHAPARGSLAVGGGVLLGTLSEALPAFETEAGLMTRRLRAGLGLRWTLPDTVRFGPGRLHRMLVSGALGACVAPVRATTLRFDLCTGLMAGLSHVRARGYAENRVARRPWVSVPLGLSLAYARRAAALELQAMALLPLYQHDFSIDGLGKAHASWPVGAALSLRVLGLWDLTDAP